MTKICSRCGKTTTNAKEEVYINGDKI